MLSNYFPDEVGVIVKAARGMSFSDRIFYEVESILLFEFREELSEEDRGKIIIYRMVKFYMEVFLVIGIVSMVLFKLISD